MALSAAGITAAIIAAGAGQSLNGPSFPMLATAIGNGTYAWAVNPANVVITGVTTGTLGAGTVLGTLTVVPLNIPAVLAALSGAGILGVLSPRLATAVATGITAAFTGAIYSGVSAGVGVGTDLASITASNPAALTAAIYAAMVNKGASSMMTAQGLGVGIATQLLGSTAVGVVAGPPSPAPAVGTSISRLV